LNTLNDKPHFENVRVTQGFRIFNYYCVKFTDWSKSLTSWFGHVTGFFSSSHLSHVVELQT